MYHQYFGLTEPAFSIAVNPRYLYMSAQHKEALAHLLYGVTGGGFVLLTGEVGTGKTTIIRSLLEQAPAHTDFAIVMNPMAEVSHMLGTICDELGVEYPGDNPSVKTLTDSLHQALLDNHRRGRNTVLLIDEAQLLSPEALEQIRLLTNLETDTQKLLQIVLVGQPELNKLLAQPRLRQLAQRITARFHLRALSLPETRAYIRHRLAVAGLSEARNPFPPRIIKKIHRASGGIPRRINILCERALIGLYGHNRHRVDVAIFRLAKREVQGDMGARRGLSPAWLALPVVLLALGAAAWLGWERLPVPGDGTSEQASVSEPDRANYRFESASAAQRQLLDHLSLDAAGPNPCWEEGPLQCETRQLDTWQALAELDRPVVLTLTTPDKFTAYAVLVGLTTERAFLRGPGGDHVVEPLAELGPAWTGRVRFVWQRPPGFSEPLGVGDRSPAVTWLARQFAEMDGQGEPLTRERYTPALAERVRIFQRRMGLADDGILGRETIMALNRVRGIDPPLTDPADIELTRGGR